MRRALVTSIGLMLLRRRLQRQSGPGAAIALVGLQLLGPRILQVRRLLVWALALTIVGGIAVAAVWWWRRGSRPEETWRACARSRACRPCRRRARRCVAAAGLGACGGVTDVVRAVGEGVVRGALDGLVPYEPGKPVEEVQRELGLERVVKLASNEGPFGPFPAAERGDGRRSRRAQPVSGRRLLPPALCARRASRRALRGGRPSAPARTP